MGVSKKQIDRTVYSEVPETCPHVDAALESAAELIKIQTCKLRDALSEYVERALNAEDEVEYLTDRVAELEKYVKNLEEEIRNPS